MDRMQLLGTLLEREERRRDEALAQWRAALQQAETAREQHAALQGYRDDYRQRWTQQFRQGGTMDILRCYQGFVERLDQAINAQQAAVGQTEQRAAQAQVHLRQRETRVAMVRKLIQRRHAAARLQQDRREQKVADEAAQRMGWTARKALQAA